MKDLNFFDSYIEKKAFRINKGLLFSIFTALVCFSLLVLAIGNQIKISRLRTHVNSLKNLAEDSNTVERVAYVKEQEEEVNRFKVEVDRIKDLSDSIDGEHTIGDDLLMMISYSMPDSIFLNTLSISQGEIYINGVSRDKWSIAEFSKGIEYIADVDQVFISNISQEEEYYKFDFNITLREVMENEKGDVVENGED